MSGYENRQVPEGINVSREHPLREFFWLSASVIGILVALVAIISLSAEFIAPFIPFESEKRIGRLIVEKLIDPKAKGSMHQVAIERYLQSLADRLAAVEEFPDDVKITVHYVDSDTVNALALLGAHIVIYRGLLEKLPHENALSMVIAHEIAHIKHRDPLIALGRGVIVLTLLSTVTGISDSGLVDGLVGQAGMITVLKFNRDQESEADREAIATLKTYYGHLSGAAALFAILDAAEKGSGSPEFLRSHPLDEKRIEAIRAAQQLEPERKTVDLPKAILDLRSRGTPESDS